jgi:GntP family gluconate:H+ symporter
VASHPAVRARAPGNLPEVKSIAALILLPIILIMLGTVAEVLPMSSAPRQIVTVLGTPFVALLLDVVVCTYVLGIRSGWSQSEVTDVVGAAIPGVAMVVMITGAGGIFANVLVVSGIGSAIAGLLRSSGLSVLGLAFILTLLLRAAQGPTTVALLTTAGIIGPLVAQAQLNESQLALVCLAMGAGGLAVSHVNDAGFWFVTRLTGLNVGDGLRSWTTLTTAAGLVGFLLIVLLWYCV